MAAARITASTGLNPVLALLVALWSNAGCIPESASPLLPGAQPVDAQPTAQVQDEEPAAAPRARLAGRWNGETHCDGRTIANGVITPISINSGFAFQLEINDAGQPLSLPVSLGSADATASIFGVGSTQSFSGSSELNGLAVTYEGSITVTKAEFKEDSFTVTYDIRMNQRGAGQTTTGVGTQSVAVTLRDAENLKYHNRLAVDWTISYEIPGQGPITYSLQQELDCSTDLTRE